MTRISKTPSRLLLVLVENLWLIGKAVWLVYSMIRANWTWPRSKILRHEALKGRRELLGVKKHPDTLHSVHNLALLLHDQQGKRDDAEVPFRKALKGCREQLGDKHPGTLTARFTTYSTMETENLEEARREAKKVEGRTKIPRKSWENATSV
jgi:hypothetical protein